MIVKNNHIAPVSFLEPQLCTSAVPVDDVHFHLHYEQRGTKTLNLFHKPPKYSKSSLLFQLSRLSDTNIQYFESC